MGAPSEAGALAGILVLDGDWVDQLYVEPGADRPRDRQRACWRSPSASARMGLRLWTFASNTGAQRFYERHGFVEVRRTDGRDNEERAPDVLYAYRAASAQAPS